MKKKITYYKVEGFIVPLENEILHICPAAELSGIQSFNWTFVLVNSRLLHGSDLKKSLHLIFAASSLFCFSILSSYVLFPS